MSITIDQTIALVQHLAWPLFAFIALIVMRPMLNELPQFVVNVRWLANNSEKIEDLVSKLTVAATTMKELKGVQEEVLDKVSLIQGQQEIIGVGDGHFPKGPTLQQSDVDADALFRGIREQWDSVKEAITTVAKRSNVPTNFIGTIGVTNTVDNLKSAGAIPVDVSLLIKDLSSRWQWMFRTSKPKNEWLNCSVAQTFAADVADVKRALLTVSG